MVHSHMGGEPGDEATNFVSTDSIKSVVFFPFRSSTHLLQEYDPVLYSQLDSCTVVPQTVKLCLGFM